MIELDRVFFSYGEKHIFSSLSLRLPDAGQVAVLGPSGCGKTTLLRLIAGLETPDAGVIRRPERIACCFQEDRLLPWYTARENVALFLPQAARQDKARAARLAQGWLERVGLGAEGDAYPDALSGGMKRRVALARALAYEAPVLLLDEPFRALDEQTHADMLRLARALCQGRLLVLVTHDERDAQGMETVQLAHL